MNGQLWIGAFLLLGGMAVLLVAAREAFHAAATRQWSVTDGVIAESRVETEIDDGTYYHHRLAYRYEVDGREFTGTRLSVGEGVVWGWAWPVRRAANRFAVGSRIRVYYSPSQPAESVLKTGVSALRLLMLAFAAVILFGTAWNQFNP